MKLLKRISLFKQYTPIKDPVRNQVNGIYFIHVPKTGGTSIAKTLGIPNYTHIKAWEVLSSGNKDLLDKNFSFGVVRNPFDRFISLYNYARMSKSYYHDNMVVPENPAFPRHLDYDLLKNASVQDCINFLKEGKLMHDKEWNQWDPQYTWLYDRKGKKPLVKKIYKIENLNDLKNDLNKLGYSISEFPKLNPSKPHDYRNILDKEAKLILEDFYSMDFDLLNYE